MKTLCLVKFSALGDLAHLDPFLPSIAKKYKITLLTSPLGFEYFKDSPFIEDFIVLPSKKFIEVLKCIPSYINKFDYFVDLQGNDRSKIMSLFSLSKRYGNYLSGYTLKEIPDELKPHIVEGSIYHLDTYSILSDLDVSFEIPPFERKTPSYIAIHPGASKGWESKRLPDEKWEEFGKVLNDRFDLPFVIIGGSEDFEYAQKIGKLLGGRFDNLCGKTSLQELKRTLTEAFLTVSTDSGPMHISAVLQTPTIGIFGATNWIRSAPFGDWSTVAYDEQIYRDETPPSTSIKHRGLFYEHISIEKSIEKLEKYIY